MVFISPTRTGSSPKKAWADLWKKPEMVEVKLLIDRLTVLSQRLVLAGSVQRLS